MLIVEQIATKSFSLLSYVIWDDESMECIVVDPPSDMLRRIDLTGMDLKVVINTHIHPDHTSGNRLFKDRAPILAHVGENTMALRLFNAVFSLFISFRTQPHISFSLSEGTNIVLGRHAITIMHTPGHSPGSICLSWDGNILTGDTVFAEGIGRTDIPGGSMACMKQSIGRIMTLPDETLIWPGHSYGNTYGATLGGIRPFLRWVVQHL
ncbi:MAG TPA: MBL fold metallo-hydrolase [Deltaproteobacteria bacterium]|nr:MBL fold metallo-hydrolase [Deltaproteobacteria bacterium]HPR55327.1 MBL fold metallo-hydrolase [Deltaproteobacteria bacterium]HXK47453.1 MBL fold metallo-hydrolase [Deltaproteobacteria bacterium]